MRKDQSNKKNALRDEVVEPTTKNRSKKKSTKKKSSRKPFFNFSIVKDERTHKILGIFFLVLSLYLLLAFVSYVFSWFNWQTDEIFSNITFSRVLFDDSIEVHNFMGRLGAALSMSFIKNGFGIASFAFTYLFFFLGFRFTFGVHIVPFGKMLKHSIFGLVWLSFTLGFLFKGVKSSILGGVFGYELSSWSIGLLGKAGTFILLLFALVSFLIVAFNFHKLFQKQEVEEEIDEQSLNTYSADGLNIDQLAALENENIEKDTDVGLELSIDEPALEVEKVESTLGLEIENEGELKDTSELDITLKDSTMPDEESGEENLELDIEKIVSEDHVDKNIPDTHGVDTEYDPVFFSVSKGSS